MAAQLVQLPPSGFSLNLALALADLQDDGIMFFTCPNSMGLDRREQNELTNAAAIIANKIRDTTYVHYFDPTGLGGREEPLFRVGPLRGKEDIIEVSGGHFIHVIDPHPCEQLRSAIAVSAATIPAVALVTPTPPPVRVPKPRNSWIIYRQEKHQWFKTHRPGTPLTEASKLISAMWKKEPMMVKIHYGMLAAEERELHGQRNPGWRVQPRKSHEIKKRRKRSVAANTQTVELGGFQSYPLTDDVMTMADQVYTPDASFSAQTAVTAFDAEESALQEYLTNTLPVEEAALQEYLTNTLPVEVATISETQNIDEEFFSSADVENFRASDVDSIAPSEEWMGAYDFRFTQEEIDMMVPDFAFD